MKKLELDAVQPEIYLYFAASKNALLTTCKDLGRSHMSIALKQLFIVQVGLI